MPKVEIELNNGTTKVVELDDNFTEDDIKQVGNQLNNAAQRPEEQPATPAQTSNNEGAKTLTGGISLTQNWDKNGNIFYTDENGNRVNNSIGLLENLKRKAQTIGTNIKDAFNSQPYDRRDTFYTSPMPTLINQYDNGAISVDELARLSKNRMDDEIYKAEKDQRESNLRSGLGTAISGASFLPIFNIPYVGTGIGGALYDVGQGLVEGDNINELVNRANRGFATGESVGAIPYVGKGINKLSGGKIGDAIANSKAAEIANKAADKFKKSKVYNTLTTDIKAFNPNKQAVYQGSPYNFEKLNNEAIGTGEGTIKELNIANNSLPSTPEVVQSANNMIEENIAKTVKPQPLQTGKEMKPSKLKSTMKKRGTLPPELQNKNIEYEVLHNADSVANAQKAIGTDAELVHRDLLKKISGQGDYENYVLSADDVIKARELATKLYQEGRASEAVDLTEGIIKAASKTGQALQAYTLWARTTPEGAVTYAEKIINRYNKSQHKDLKLTDEQINNIRKLAEQVQKTAEGTRENEVAIGKMQKYIADLTPVSWQKKYDTFRYINMLLSPKSRTKDFLLTGLNSADSAIDELIANGIDRARVLLPKQSKRVFSGLKPKEWAEGIKKGFKEGIEDVNLNINTSRSGETGRYGLPKTRSFNFTPLSQIEKTPKGLLQLGENALAAGEKGLNYTLQVPDRMFYEARYASSLADQMRAAGVKKPTSAMIEQARKEALEAVYQDDTWVSRLGNSTRNLVNNVSGNLEESFRLPENSVPRVGNFLAPFVTTPANIVNIGLKNTFGTPVGLAKLLRATTPQEIRDAELLMARGIKGVAPLGIGLGIGSGNIKSNIGNENYQENAVTGLKPQSIVIGNKAISLKDYPQWSIPMAIGAGLQQGGIPQAAVNTVNAVSDISALKSLGDIVDAFRPKYGQDPNAADIANNLFRTQGVNIISQNIPFGGWLGEIRNDIDPYAREMYMPTGETTPEMALNSIKYAGNRLQNRIPIASRYLPQKYNAIGEPTMINNIQNPLARVASEAIDFGIRNYNENPVYNELANFQEEIKDTDYTGKTKAGLHTPPRSIKVNGDTIKLDNKQYSDFSQDYTKINYILKGMALNDSEFKAMDDEEKTKYLSDLRKSAEEAVKIMQFDHKPTKKYHPYTQYILDNYLDLVRD